MVTVAEKQQPYWPFPTKDNPLKPWTPEQVKKYNEQQRQSVPDAPMLSNHS